MKNPILLSIIGVVVIAGGALLTMTVFRGDEPRSSEPVTNTTTITNTTGTNTTVQNQNTNTAAAVSSVTWQNTANGWQPSGTPPTCPSIIPAPADLNLATAILYPGQTRGGNYKPHGGIRFDTITNNVVSVKAPMSGQVVRGARYLVSGEIQYTFDIIAPCGLMVRLGHFRELTQKFQTIADTFPAAQENDSRTTYLNPYVNVTAGEEIATKVGTTKDQNTFFDFGLYDLKQKNVASQNPTYAAAHSNDVELAQHALCWFGYMSAADKAIIAKLPAGDPTSGKKSDYCTAADLAL